MNNPKISVIMAAYNEEKYIGEAIESILNQTYTDFEFIIVNDCSTDRTLQIIKEYSNKDKRIVIIDNSTNLRLAASLNKGIDIARGEYIARMDADDLCLNSRFSKQVECLEKHPEYSACSSWMKFYPSLKLAKLACQHDAIKVKMLFNSSFAHAPVLIRRNVLNSLKYVYDPQLSLAEDYDLFVRCLTELKDVNFYQIQEPLYFYRKRDVKDEKEKIYLEKQIAIADVARRKMLNFIGIFPSDDEFNCHKLLSYSNASKDKKEYQRCVEWTKKVENANRSANFFKPELLRAEFNNRLKKAKLKFNPFRKFAKILLKKGYHKNG